MGLKRRALGLNLHSAVIGVISPAIANLGLITFLEAAAKISQGYPNVEFLLVGDGVDQERLSLLAHDLGIGGATIFRGTRTDVPEIIGSLNTLVIPHDIPGAVGLALQAVIQEIPVVAVRTAALTEVLADVCPEALVNPEDAEALVKGVARNLELLPPPEADAGVFVDGGITLSYSDLLVAQESYDLDTAGLEVETRELSPVRRAARQAQARYSPTALVRATESLYAEILTTGAERLVPQVRHL